MAPWQPPFATPSLHNCDLVHVLESHNIGTAATGDYIVFELEKRTIISRRRVPLDCMRFSHLRAQLNSVANMASPNAMVSSPGPGTTSIIKPEASNTNPPAILNTRFVRPAVCATNVALPTRPLDCGPTH